jgi:hypothetical protein
MADESTPKVINLLDAKKKREEAQKEVVGEVHLHEYDWDDNSVGIFEDGTVVLIYCPTEGAGLHMKREAAKNLGIALIAAAEAEVDPDAEEPDEEEE